MRRRKMHIITKIITWALVAVFLISGCSLDSETWLPYITTAVSMLFLALIAWFHGYIA